MKRSSGDKPIDVIEISDDESPSKRPPQKNMKRDGEQFPSQAILGMHQNLVKMDKDYQDACRLAAEAQKRVAFLENLLDKKPDASEDTEKEELKKKNDELTRRLACVEVQLQSERKHIEDLQKKLAETSTELEKRKREATNWDEQLTKLEKDYQGVCRIANEFEIDLYVANARVHDLENIIGNNSVSAHVVVEDKEKNLVTELQKKLAETSNQLEKERSEGAIREEKLKESVRSLTQRVEEAEAREGRNNREIRIDQSRLSKAAGGPSVSAKVDADVVLVSPTKTPDTTVSPNLCEPCMWRESPESIHFSRALSQLRSKYYPSDEEWMRKCRNVLYGETHACTLCEKGTMASTSILSHFFSRGHGDEMRAHNAGIPRATFEYWMAKLDSIPKPVISKVNTDAIKRFLPQGTVVNKATSVTVMEKKPTPTPKVAARAFTAVVCPTVTDGTPATKVQVAAVAPIVTAPSEAAEVVEVLKPVNKELTGRDRKKEDCIVVE